MAASLQPSFSGRKCGECGSLAIIEDRQQGHAVCRECGAVVESSYIVSELQFEETSGGGMRATGTLIGSSGVSRVGGIVAGSSGAAERRGILVSRARLELQRIAAGDPLYFSDDAIAQAANFYEMALNRRLTAGVRRVKTLSACVYIVARLRNMPIMLLDLSDIVHVNVWELGSVYNRITRGLFITIPVQDPSLLIERFSRRLRMSIAGELSEKSGCSEGSVDSEKAVDQLHGAERGQDCQLLLQRVMNTAVRICQRMSRDWMVVGRRPAGLCGSALLAASRYHGINRTFEELADIVCMSTTTLRLRLREFADTPAGRMQLGDFLAADDSEIPDEELPPVTKMRQHYRNISRRYCEKDVKALGNSICDGIKTGILEGDAVIDDSLLEEARVFQERLEHVIENRQMEVALRFANAANDEEVRRRFELTEQEMDILSWQISASATEVLCDNSSITSVAAPLDFNQNKLCDAALISSPGADNSLAGPSGRAVSDMHSEQESDSHNGILQFSGGEQQPLQVKNLSTAGAHRPADYVVPEERDNDNFSDVDDREIEVYFLKPDEVVRKTKKWVQENIEFLKECREKEAKRKEETEKKRKKKPRGQASASKRPNVRENPFKHLEDIMEEKKISGKINYSILERLKSDDASSLPKRKSKAISPKAEAKRELQLDLKEIQLLANDIKKDIRVKHENSDSALHINDQQMSANDDLLVEDVDDDDSDDQHTDGMLSVSQIMSQEMGLDYGDSEEDY